MSSESTISDGVTVLAQDIDETEETGMSVIELDDRIFYTYSDSELSYCSEITPEGIIQFSYMFSSSENISESEIYELTEMYNILNIEISEEDECYTKINEAIIENIITGDVLFETANVHTADEIILEEKDISVDEGEIVETNAKFSTLDAAVSSFFGEEYSNRIVGTATRTHGKNSYTVNVKQTHSISNSTITSRAFSKGAAITLVIAWLTSGDYTWVGVVKTIVLQVVTTVVAEGVTAVKTAFTGKRTNVTSKKTRNVKINGYSGIYYWARWTQKTYFFKGNNGWAHDSDTNYELKDSDYNSISTLINTGFQNFVNDL